MKLLTLNKGEWAEYYVQFKTVAEGKLSLCDADLLPTNEFIEVIGGKLQNIDYLIKENSFHKEQIIIDRNDFSNSAKIILHRATAYRFYDSEDYMKLLRHRNIEGKEYSIFN